MKDTLPLIFCSILLRKYGEIPVKKTFICAVGMLALLSIGCTKKVEPLPPPPVQAAAVETASVFMSSEAEILAVLTPTSHFVFDYSEELGRTLKDFAGTAQIELSPLEVSETNVVTAEVHVTVPEEHAVDAAFENKLDDAPKTTYSFPLSGTKYTASALTSPRATYIFEHVYEVSVSESPQDALLSPVIVLQDNVYYNDLQIRTTWWTL